MQDTYYTGCIDTLFCVSLFIYISGQCISKITLFNAYDESYCIVSCAVQPGTCPSVTSQAGVGEKYATGCDSLSLSFIPSGKKNSKTSCVSNEYQKIRIASINV